MIDGWLKLVNAPYPLHWLCMLSSQLCLALLLSWWTLGDVYWQVNEAKQRLTERQMQLTQQVSDYRQRYSLASPLATTSEAPTYSLEELIFNYPEQLVSWQRGAKTQVLTLKLTWHDFLRFHKDFNQLPITSLPQQLLITAQEAGIYVQITLVA